VLHGAAAHAALPDSAGIHESWELGVMAYEQGEYEKALESWQALADRGLEHPDLFFNMGNAYYQMEQKGRAAWMYERALSRDARHADARRNLALVRNEHAAQGDQSTSSFLMLPFAYVAQLLTLGEWAALCAAAWWLTAIGFALALASNRPRLHAASRAVAIVAAIGLAVSLLFFLPQLHHARTRSHGIVLEPGAIVRAGPSEREPEYFEAVEGERMEITLTPVRGWVRVKRPADGRVGFLPENVIGQV